TEGFVRTSHPMRRGATGGREVTDNLWNLDEGTRNDLRLLLATLKEYSSYVLLDCPVFRPFGAALNNAGNVGLVVAQLEGQPALSEYRDALLRGLRGQAERGEIRAARICEQGRAKLPGMSDEAPVIWISIEHQSDLSVVVSVPYSVDGPDKVSFGE